MLKEKQLVVGYRKAKRMKNQYLKFIAILEEQHTCKYPMWSIRRFSGFKSR